MSDPTQALAGRARFDIDRREHLAEYRVEYRHEQLFPGYEMPVEAGRVDAHGLAERTGGQAVGPRLLEKGPGGSDEVLSGEQGRATDHHLIVGMAIPKLVVGARDLYD